MPNWNRFKRRERKRGANSVSNSSSSFVLNESREMVQMLKKNVGVRKDKISVMDHDVETGRHDSESEI